MIYDQIKIIIYNQQLIIKINNFCFILLNGTKKYYSYKILLKTKNSVNNIIQ